MECRCDDPGFIHQCELHVRCDDKCRALQDPVTDDETDAALHHWQYHSVMGGCSHGA